MYPWLHLGPVSISTYSLLFLCAFAVGGWVTYREARRQHRATEELLQVALGALAGGLIGAKLSMLLFLGPGTFLKDLPTLWYSGQAWTGGFLLGGDPFGLPSNLPWAILQHGVRRQPSAFYELVLDLALFVLLLRLRDRLPHAGDLFTVYVLGYLGLRFLVDFTRADPHVVLGLTLVQVLYALSFPLFARKLWRSFQLSRQARVAVPQTAVPAA
jgi:prolipoprotein diacylglyceryltransferase